MSSVAGPRVRRILAYLVLALVAIEASLVALIAYGIIPNTRAIVEVEAPLYPRKAFHYLEYRVDFDRGAYVVEFSSRANTTLTVVCPLPSREESVGLGPGDEATVELYCYTGIQVFIEAVLEPFQDSIGVLEVSNRWRLERSG